MNLKLLPLRAFAKISLTLAAAAGLFDLQLWGQGAGPGADEITSVSQLNRLQPTSTPKPIRIRGIVVCYDAGWHQLYLHDGAHTTYFNADEFKAPMELGYE